MPVTEESSNLAMHFLRHDYALGKVAVDGLELDDPELVAMIRTLDQYQIRELELESALGCLSAEEHQSLKDKHPLYNFEHEHCRQLFLTKMKEAIAAGVLVKPPSEDIKEWIAASKDISFDSYPIGQYIESRYSRCNTGP